MASVLFGDSNLNARRKFQSEYHDHDHDRSFAHSNNNNNKDEQGDINSNISTYSSQHPQLERPAKGSLADFFFGFMYEDDALLFDEESALYRSSIVEPSTNLWNPLHVALCSALALTSAAAAVPVSLMPVLSFPTTMSAAANTATDTTTSSSNNNNNVALPTAAAVLGAACGKFINGPICDIMGARRCSVVYSIVLAAALVFLSTAQTMSTVARACFFVEFANSIQWPSIIVTLATHYRNNSTGMYEGGVFVTSLASRLGSLLSIVVGAWLLRQGVAWQTIPLLGAWASLVAASITYLHVSDSPNQLHQPQNPVDWQQEKQKWNTAANSGSRHINSNNRNWIDLTTTKLYYIWNMAKSILQTNVIPSLRHILGSPTFWMVALAHTGACMVRTSERMLGTYFWQTSHVVYLNSGSTGSQQQDQQSYQHLYHYYHHHPLEQSRAAVLSVFFSVGTVAGLLTAGKAFASQTERQRKWLVWRLYVMAIVACYVLAALGLDMIRHRFFLSSSLDLLTIFQVMAVVVAGFGTAVQYFHIPSLVGASFGVDKGMFCAYVDGVAFALASVVWGYWIGTNDTTNANTNAITGDANVMETPYNDNGWAYTWAAVALLLILSSILMVEFMEHYFCRAARTISGTYETIILA